MLGLNDLPPELLLVILRYLPLQSLSSMSQVSREWRNFISENELTIFRNAALLHHFIPSIRASLEDSKKAYAGTFLCDVQDWRSFDYTLFQLQKNWAGMTQSKPTIRRYKAPTYNVHRLKVDERHHILITTSSKGGLLVTDLNTDTVLWELPHMYVRHYAHCEYQNGFLVFDRFGEFKEVWRLTMDYDETAAALVAEPPDYVQLRIGDLMSATFSSEDGRGHFKPWALLNMPEFGRAFRFVYPTLFVSSMTKTYLFDVVQGKLAQTIAYNAEDSDVEGVNYVELNDRYLFLCTPENLRIYRRANGQNVLRIPSISLPSCPSFVVDPKIFEDHSRDNKDTAMAVPLRPLSEPVKSLRDTEFVGVHVCGSNLVAMLNDNRIILIRDYERVITSKVDLSDLMLQLVLRHPDSTDPIGDSIYIAYEHGHVSVVTTSGLFVITVDAEYHGVVKHHWQHPEASDKPASLTSTPFPSLLVCRINPFNDDHILRRTSCLQMSDSKIYLTYDPYPIRRLTKEQRRAADAERHASETDSRPSLVQDRDTLYMNSHPTHSAPAEEDPIEWGNTEYMPIDVDAHEGDVEEEEVIGIGDEITAEEAAHFAAEHVGDELQFEDLNEEHEIHMDEEEDTETDEDEEQWAANAVVCVDFGP